MIEFTLSRVALCACGMAVLATVAGFMLAVDDSRQEDMDVYLVNDIALMLDEMERTGLDRTVLDGSSLLPSAEHRLTVEDGMVRLHHGDRQTVATTVMKQNFELGYGDLLVLDLSVPEGLGYLPDGVGEDVDLLEAVVKVDGRACAAVHSP